jgi:hypothetical protein
MALLANDAADRAGQLIMLTDRLAGLIDLETQRVEARQPPLDGEEAEEKNRLANAYRLELARIKLDPELLKDAPAPLLSKLKAGTTALHEALSRHDVALGAMKLIAEGLVQAMAEEVTRQRGGARGYGAGGALAESGGAIPVALDRLA